MPMHCLLSSCFPKANPAAGRASTSAFPILAPATASTPSPKPMEIFILESQVTTEQMVKCHVLGLASGDGKYS